MAKAPCIRCKVGDKAPGLQKCVECWLSEQPAHVQEDAAAQRLAMVPEELRLARVPADQWPAGRRWCAPCQSFRRLSECRGSQCKACASRAAHDAHVVRTFGLAPGDYAALFVAQKGRCAICRNRPKTERLAVDHDHKTLAPRGLLCSRCNHDLLGAAHDSLRILKAAVSYLEDPPYGRFSSLKDSSPPSSAR